jgi:hypothetical protein
MRRNGISDFRATIGDAQTVQATKSIQQTGAVHAAFNYERIDCTFFIIARHREGVQHACPVHCLRFRQCCVVRNDIQSFILPKVWPIVGTFHFHE